METDGILHYRQYLQGKITFRTLNVYFAKFFLNVFQNLSKKYFNFEWVKDVNKWVISQFSSIG